MNQNKHQRMGSVDKAERLSIGRQCGLFAVQCDEFGMVPADPAIGH